MRRKKILALALAVTMASGMSMTSFAGEWQQDAAGSWYQEDNGSYPANTWKWIDGNNDGVAECYYFNENGYMLSNTTTPDGYQVNASGAWVVNGVVQTQATGNSGNAAHSGNYDPAHPLAGKIDEWNLRLPTKYLGEFIVCNNNVQAMLTGQMDQYYLSPVGYSTDKLGNQVYTTQEGHDRAVAEEQALYNWFCNWLNSMNFESMSEMDRAKEIQKVLAQGINITGKDSNTRNAEHSVLIDKQGMCAEYAMTVTSLAKALGLKSAVSGSGIHAVYYIQVDGVGYFGQNNKLVLDYPTPDYVYFQ